jgi:hypothetical protein
LDNLYRIVNETGQNVPFARNDVRQRMWDELHDWNIILKGRQHGISSFILLLMLDTCLFTPNTHCGLIADSFTGASPVHKVIGVQGGGESKR